MIYIRILVQQKLTFVFRSSRHLSNRPRPRWKKYVCSITTCWLIPDDFYASSALQRTSTLFFRLYRQQMFTPQCLRVFKLALQLIISMEMFQLRSPLPRGLPSRFGFPRHISLTIVHYGILHDLHIQSVNFFSLVSTTVLQPILCG